MDTLWLTVSKAGKRRLGKTPSKLHKYISFCPGHCCVWRQPFDYFRNFNSRVYSSTSNVYPIWLLTIPWGLKHPIYSPWYWPKVSARNPQNFPAELNMLVSIWWRTRVSFYREKAPNFWNFHHKLTSEIFFWKLLHKYWEFLRPTSSHEAHRGSKFSA